MLLFNGYTPWKSSKENSKRWKNLAAKKAIVRSERRNTMKSSIRDKAEGKFHEAKGKVKEVAGEITDNSELEAEGTGEKIAGKVQGKVGQVKKVLGK
jgi:uncharacterized protein YjbJ (UPF0337 family)